MFPETSQLSAQCILPPVIYDVPRLSLPFLSFLAHSPIPTRWFLSSCPFFIVLSVAPDFRLLALVEHLHPLFSQISSVRWSDARPSRSLYFPAHSTSSVRKEFRSSLMIPDWQMKPAYCTDFKNKTRFGRKRSDYVLRFLHLKCSSCYIIILRQKCNSWFETLNWTYSFISYISFHILINNLFKRKIV